LWVNLARGHEGRVSAIGGSRGDTVTAGIYVFPEKVRRLAWPADLGRLREYLAWLGRETDDAEILQATAVELSAHGFAVTLKSPDELPAADDPDVPPFLFAMCER